MSDRALSSMLVGHCGHEVSQELEILLGAPVECVGSPTAAARISGVVVGSLVGFDDGGATPLVLYPGQPGSAALPARATLDLHAPHIGREAVLMFDEGDPYRPIVIGCLQGERANSLPDVPGRVEVDADGQRLVVTAKEQLVLRCGAASITLTKAGKVMIRGTYVSNRSSGVLRLRGGSVQIN